MTRSHQWRIFLLHLFPSLHPLLFRFGRDLLLRLLRTLLLQQLYLLAQSLLFLQTRSLLFASPQPSSCHPRTRPLGSSAPSSPADSWPGVWFLPSFIPPATHSDLSCWPRRSAPNFSASQIVDLWRVHDARLQPLLYLFWTDGQNNVRRSWEWLSAGSKSVWCKWPLMHYYFFFLPEPWIWCQSSSSSFCPTTLTLCRCCFFFSAAAAPLFPPFLFFYVHFVQMSLHFIYIYSVNLPVPDGGSAHACTALVLHKLGNVDKAARHTEPCLSSCNYQFFCRCNDWELVHR